MKKLFKQNKPVDPGPPPKPPEPGGGKSIDTTALILVAIGLFFLVALSMYNLSHEGYLRLSEKTWKGIWVFAENGILIFLCLLVSLLTYGTLKDIFRWVFIPYFIIRIAYYLSCYLGFVTFSNDAWSIILVAEIIVSLGIVLIKNRHA
jgi:hypothetical protein